MTTGKIFLLVIGGKDYEKRIKLPDLFKIRARMEKKENKLTEIRVDCNSLFNIEITFECKNFQIDI